MMAILPTKHAKRMAREWAERQDDLPYGWYILARHYDRKCRGRRFSVQLSVKSRGRRNSRVFGLITLLVKDDRTIEIKKDRRGYIRTLLEDSDYEVTCPPHHSAPGYTQAEAEEHLLKVLEYSKDTLPKWYGGMRRATEEERKSQVDLWCDLENRLGDKTTVPVKVFVSRATKAEFFKSLPIERSRHYAGIMVISGCNDAQLAQETIKYLNHLRKQYLC